MAENNHLLIPSKSGGKQISVSTVFQLEAFAKIRYRCREIPYGKVGLPQGLQRFLILLAETKNSFHSEGPTWEILYFFGGGIKMAVGVQGLHG